MASWGLACKAWSLGFGVPDLFNTVELTQIDLNVEGNGNRTRMSNALGFLT